MARWNPPNVGYKTTGPGNTPVPTQYDVTKSNPDGGPLPLCPCGGKTFRIGGSGTFDARCVQCQAQYSFFNLTGAATWPRDSTVFPVAPPGAKSIRPPKNYQQPNVDAPPPHPNVATYPVVPPPNSNPGRTENYQQPDYRVPEVDPSVGSHYGRTPPNE
jgi:hypothetical protein